MDRSHHKQGVTVFLCGDVMLGRGIDQILPHPVDPILREGFATSALDYVELAERAHGPIPRKVAPGYVWGDALEVLNELAPDVRIVNLETSVTETADFWPKPVNYRASPINAKAVLEAAAIDCVALANNHVLDFGPAGLADTLEAVEAAGVKPAGAGPDSQAAAAPAILGGRRARRILVFGFGTLQSGIAPEWAAGPHTPGVNLLPDLSETTLTDVLARAAAVRRPGDVLVASIHWGGNWGYGVPPEQVRFAHGLIAGGFDVVHGHSSHHAKAVEIRGGRPILYGCGDFITDYEGIGGHEGYRGDISVAYFPELGGTDGRDETLSIVPFRLRNFRLERAPREDAAWLAHVLDRESSRFGTRVALQRDGTLRAEAT